MYIATQWQAELWYITASSGDIERVIEHENT